MVKCDKFEKFWCGRCRHGKEHEALTLKATEEQEKQFCSEPTYCLVGGMEVDCCCK